MTLDRAGRRPGRAAVAALLRAVVKTRDVAQRVLGSARAFIGLSSWPMKLSDPRRRHQWPRPDLRTHAGRWVAALLRDRARGPAEFHARLTDLRMRHLALPRRQAWQLVGDVLREADRCDGELRDQVRSAFRGFLE